MMRTPEGLASQAAIRPTDTALTSNYRGTFTPRAGYRSTLFCRGTALKFRFYSKRLQIIGPIWLAGLFILTPVPPISAGERQFGCPTGSSALSFPEFRKFRRTVQHERCTKITGYYQALSRPRHTDSSSRVRARYIDFETAQLNGAPISFLLWSLPRHARNLRIRDGGEWNRSHARVALHTGPASVGRVRFARFPLHRIE